jgi:hypothetical protein
MDKARSVSALSGFTALLLSLSLSLSLFSPFSLAVPSGPEGVRADESVVPSSA